jgi:mannose-6-phosphate isomerase-like protein (cupin superfamily)
MSSRSLFALRGIFCLTALLAWRAFPGGQSPTSVDGYVLAAGEGEILQRPNGRVVIKVDPKQSSRHLAAGIQELNAGSGIPVHRHENADEVLVIQKGRAVAVLGDRRVSVEAGATVFVPRGVWHGVENTGQPIELMWIVTPPGLEGFFREVGSSPGTPLKQLSPAEMEEIGRKHGTSFRR